MKWLLSFLWDLLGKLFGQPAAPSPEAVQAAAAAQAETAGHVDQASAVAETAIAQAEADAPKDQAAVVDSLDKGTF